MLRGPPSVEFVPYGKVPRTKVRKDARQGTIDQDPEFIEFLESLTNPVPKPTSVDQQTASTNKGREKITTTPLIQFLKEKKANKGKEGTAAAAKNAKNTRQTSKDTLSSSNSGSDKTSPAKSVASTGQTLEKRSAQAIMVEKAARDAARVLNKQVAASSKPQNPSPAPASPAVSPATAANSPLAEKKRERGSASAAASILRRDLGIGTSPGARGGRRGLPAGQNRPTPTSSPKASSAIPTQGDNAKTTDNSTANVAGTSSNTNNTKTASAATTAPGQTRPTVQPPTGPAASRVPPKGPASASGAPTSNTASTPPKPSPTPSTATQAFLKHANPSQGITEPLLEEAFSTFGAVKRVEIDRKKGSAYVDFEEPEGLQKAIKASPVKVAQGHVVVLERRIGPNPQARSVRGGPMMNNRGSMDGKGGLVNQRGDMRGGVMNNRGGGIPMGHMGARGGGVRGRGFVRGRGNMPNTVSTRPPTTTSSQSVRESKTPASTATIADNEPAPPKPPESTEAAEPSAAQPSESTAVVGERT